MTAPTDHFSSVARQYALSRPSYPEALFDWLAAHCAQREAAWDAGAGSGQATLALAQRFAHVLATDLSERQLEQLPARANVRTRAAPAHDSALPTRSVDLITVAQALHWFDVERFHAEAARVLRAGGLIAEWTYGMLDIDGGAVNRIVADFYAGELDAYWPPERRHVENEYADFGFPFHRVAAPQFAMRLRWNLSELLGYLRSWSAVARLQAVTGTDPVIALGERLAFAWGDADGAREIRWPLALRVGVA